MLEDTQKKGKLRCVRALQRSKHRGAQLYVCVGTAFPTYIRNLKGMMMRVRERGEGRKETGREEGDKGTLKNWFV